MGKFMKILLIKRLESSFFAFRNSISRFIHSYELFIREFEKGRVYTSKKHTAKIFEYLDSDNDEAIQQLIDSGKADEFKSGAFKPEFLEILKSDLAILQQIQRSWARVKRDPKLNTILDVLAANPLLQDSKIILFSESRETAEYITGHINQVYPNQALCFSGNSGEGAREVVIQNFDAKARKPKDDYRILVATEVLSEGVNLHRSNIVINYDLPWNPTRMMQRVGRINRVDTKFDTIYTFNFFPTTQANNELKLKEAAEAKINAFLTLLGGDAALLTDGEPVGSHELFNRLISNKALTGEDEGETSELKYLTLIKNIRDQDEDFFEKIKKLPRKGRAAKAWTTPPGLDTGREGAAPARPAGLVTYFRKGKVQKFFQAGDSGPAEELDFISAAGMLECEADEPKRGIPKTYFDLLDKNKEAFVYATMADGAEPQGSKGSDVSVKVLKVLKMTARNTKPLTEEQEEYLKKVMAQLEEGGLTKQTARTTHKALQDLGSEQLNPLKVLAVLQTHIPARFLESHYAEESPRSECPREVILSMYLAE
jgi:superfamily II DNA/RNA helicase